MSSHLIQYFVFGFFFLRSQLAINFSAEWPKLKYFIICLPYCSIFAILNAILQSFIELLQMSIENTKKEKYVYFDHQNQRLMVTEKHPSNFGWVKSPRFLMGQWKYEHPLCARLHLFVPQQVDMTFEMLQLPMGPNWQLALKS